MNAYWDSYDCEVHCEEYGEYDMDTDSGDRNELVHYMDAYGNLLELSRICTETVGSLLDISNRLTDTVREVLEASRDSDEEYEDAST
jgi:hypothetical protein